MDKRALILLAAAAGGFAWWYMASQVDPAESGGQSETSLIESAMSTVTNLMTSVPDAVQDPQVWAFLQLIRAGEGTTGPDGYRTMFGGGLFASYADHPRRAITRGSITSTAAGAYQFLSRTWDEMASAYGLADFSPANQDVAAVGLIKRRGALADVLAGRFRDAIDKCSKEWASLPGSPYGQPTLSYVQAQDILLAHGADILGSVA
ncbi:MAG: glycoside hydrolase family 104 protein [Massilia sp.]